MRQCFMQLLLSRGSKISTGMIFQEQETGLVHLICCWIVPHRPLLGLCQGTRRGNEGSRTRESAHIKHDTSELL